MKTRGVRCGLAWAGALWLVGAVPLWAQVYTVGTLAGDPSVLDGQGNPVGGYADGTNGAALFNFPQAVAVDGAGTVFVADTLNNSIRAMRPAGSDWVVTTVAGAGPTFSGSADGTNSQARFNFPFGVAVDRGGNLYVADGFNYVIRKITRVGGDWVVSTIAGLAGAQGATDGLGSAARFYSPSSVTVDAATNVFVADCNAQLIRKLRPVGTNWEVTTIAGAYLQTGSADGTNSQARFNSPGSIVADSAGRVYVSDWYNSTVRQITPVDTNYVVTTIAGKAGQAAWLDGTNSDARFTSPLGGIGLDSAGNLYVTDAGMVRKITSEGTNWVVTTIAGSYNAVGTADGIGSNARFHYPQAVAADVRGNLYVADSDNHTIRIAVPASNTPPGLQVACRARQAVLSWPLAAAGFLLETGSPQADSPQWSTVSSGVVISGSSFVFTNNAGNATGLYRLRLGP